MLKNVSSMSRLRHDVRQASFTLLETVIALGLIAAIIMEVTSVQGNAIYFSSYGRNVNQAIWVAKQMLSQVEYQVKNAETFKDVKESEVEKEFKVEGYEDFKVTLKIEDWKLPITEILTGGLSGKDKETGDGQEQDAAGGLGEGLEPIIKQVFGDEPILKIAKVEVSWPEGIHRGNISASLLLTNQQKVDQQIAMVGALAAQSPAGSPAAQTASPNSNGTAQNPAGTGTSNGTGSTTDGNDNGIGDDNGDAGAD